MTDKIITPADIEEAKGCPTLGPAYFTAQRVVGEAMASLDKAAFASAVEDFLKEFIDEARNQLEDHLWSDAEQNLELKFRQTLDDAIHALLRGDKWALDRYPFLATYEGPKLREAIMKHIPEGMRDARIRDLEEKVKSLQADLERERKYNDRYR